MGTGATSWTTVPFCKSPRGPVSTGVQASGTRGAWGQEFPAPSQSLSRSPGLFHKVPAKGGDARPSNSICGNAAEVWSVLEGKFECVLAPRSELNQGVCA